MSDNTKIEWTNATVNAVNGCSVISPGCKHCYAMKQAHRFPVRQGLTHKTAGGMVWTGEVRFSESALRQPLRWKRPRKIFWNAHGDLFHENVPDEWIDRVFAVCALTPQHQHQILTKRSARMRAYCSDPHTPERIARVILDLGADWGVSGAQALAPLGNRATEADPSFVIWPLSNVWLGVSVEDQQRADDRIPDLLATPAAVRFLSCEPLLGPVDLASPYTLGLWNEKANERGILGDARMDPTTGLWDVSGEDLLPGLDWVIVGGESGPGARPMHPDWARWLRDQCAAAGVPFFFKQWGEWAPVSDIDIDAMEDKLYYPAPAQVPEATRRCAVEQCVLHRNGHRFAMNEWSAVQDDETLRAFQAGCGGMTMMRLGKARTGRLLRGIQHDGMPA